MEDVVESGRRGRSGARNSGRGFGGGGTEWANLLSDVEDLVKRVADVDDADIARIRSRVEDTLAKAKSTAGAGLAAARERAEDASEATDEYVRENPWAAIGIAAAIGIVIGLVAGRR